MSLEAALAVQRFGLGARQGELDRVGGDPKAWLMEQLHRGAEQPTPFGQPFLSTGELTHQFTEYVREHRLAEQNGANKDQAQAVVNAFKSYSQRFKEETTARFALGFATARPFAERLVWFWSNHFAVSIQGGAINFSGDFERTAIRPHIGGKFEDMLLAAITHPAMLLYLSNAQSIGPESMAARFSGKGLNENLGREVMELHTLGVDGGYTQDDVIAMAKLLTGWSLDSSGGASGFRYFSARHEPGDIVLRGKTYPRGEEGGRMALHDLANDPHTARHIAKKFAAHFLADDPPAERIEALMTVFLDTGGDLTALSETLLKDPGAFSAPLSKFRPPVGFITAAYRMLNWPFPKGDKEKQVLGAMQACRLLGEFPLSPPSPKGWPDDAQSWAGANSILNRIDWAQQVARNIPQSFDAVVLAQNVMGPLLRPETVTAMRAAPNTGTAVALLIASPEFQRR